MSCDLVCSVFVKTLHNYFGKMHLGYVVLLILMGPAILVSPSSAQEADCGNVPVDLCFEKLQTFLKLKSLPFTSDEHQLDTLCSVAVGGYDCSARLTRNSACISPTDRDLMLVYVKMAEYMVLMFCKMPGSEMQAYRRNDLLKSSECIMKHKKNLDCCAEQSQISDLPILNILSNPSKSFNEKQISACCPLSSYFNCAYTVMEKDCGKVAANVTYEYIRRAAGEQLQGVCQKVQGYPEPSEEVCKMSPPVCAGCRIEVLMELLCLMSLLFVALNSYI